MPMIPLAIPRKGPDMIRPANGIGISQNLPSLKNAGRQKTIRALNSMGFAISPTGNGDFTKLSMFKNWVIPIKT
uniref:Uncharacterized protein n=1 Tax=viral metagenome TaxID=1070528 RepID=A0A6H1ZRF3_9ZZZZ